MSASSTSSAPRGITNPDDQRPAFTLVPAVDCPEWCQSPGHHFTPDSGRMTRDHDGPLFGAYVAAGAFEDAASGELRPYVQVHADGLFMFDPAKLLEHCAAVQAAAEWLASVQ